MENPYCSCKLRSSPTTQLFPEPFWIKPLEHFMSGASCQAKVPTPPKCPGGSVGPPLPPGKAWHQGGDSNDWNCCTSGANRGAGHNCNESCAHAECTAAGMHWRNRSAKQPYTCCNPHIVPAKSDDNDANGRAINRVWADSTTLETARDCTEARAFLALKTDDPARVAQAFPKCTCANASLCRPLAGPRPAKTVRVVSDCGGPRSEHCDWHGFDWAGITEISRQAGHQLLVSSDGSVSINANRNVPRGLRWPQSELLCYAHARGVRMLATVLPGGHGSFNIAPPLNYSLLLSNASAIERMAKGLATAVTAAGFDGVGFDFESIQSSWPPGSTFDIGAANVAMVAQTAAALRALQPHGTVSLDVGCRFDTAREHAYYTAYPVATLAKAVDEVFIMGYGFSYGGPRYETRKAGLVCAGPNAPLSAITDIVTRWVKNDGVPAGKLTLGIPWFGWQYSCNSSDIPSSYAPCANSTCVTGTVANLAQPCHSASCAPGFWETQLNESSASCTKRWDSVAASPFLDCGEGAARTQTWFDDARSTALKVQLAKTLGLGGVGVFTGEAVGTGPAAQEMWGALCGFLD